jgi:hypothetical protein
VLLTAGQVVEYRNPVAAAYEFIDGVRTDKSGAAGNYVTHSATPPLIFNPLSPTQYSHQGLRVVIGYQRRLPSLFMATGLNFRYASL